MKSDNQQDFIHSKLLVNWPEKLLLAPHQMPWMSNTEQTKMGCHGSLTIERYALATN